MDVEVRRALPDDAAGIAAVHVNSWRAAYRGLLPDDVLDGLSVTQREQFWSETLGAEKRPMLFVAERDGVVVGFCGMALPSRDGDLGEGVAEIGAIYVSPDLWRSGVGSELLGAALSELRGGDWRAVALWVLAENHRALGFYGQFGFAADGATRSERTGQAEIRLRLDWAD